LTLQLKQLDVNLKRKLANLFRAHPREGVRAGAHTPFSQSPGGGEGGSPHPLLPVPGRGLGEGVRAGAHTPFSQSPGGDWGRG